jgi:hypothetical protein
MTRTDIINSLIKKNNYTSYLEIGVQSGVNFKAIEAERKIGIDPDLFSKATNHCTSDEFFKKWKGLLHFDIIFIDGLHEYLQVWTDIINSLEMLNPNGVIVCHDMIPFDEMSQRVPRVTKRWTGDCWKAFLELKSKRDDLDMKVVDTDCGCGIIKFGEQKLVENPSYVYEEFEKNKKEWMNIITPQEFKDLYLC